MGALQSQPVWTQADSEDSKRIWKEYPQSHDLSRLHGKTAGVDPKTGGVWFGDSIRDVVAQRREQGLESPLFFFRVGFETYYRKGSRR